MGKTTDLIGLSAETGAYIVCFDHQEAYRVAMLAKKMGLSIPFPLELGEFSKRQFDPDIHLLIDNLDRLLPYLCGAVVDAVTMTGDPE